MGSVFAWYDAPAASATARLASEATTSVIQPCLRSASSGNEYAWFRIKRKRVGDAFDPAEMRRYSLHHQARSAYRAFAEHSRMDVWRKFRPTDRRRKRHTNQTNPGRPKTRYYAHTQVHVRRDTYFRWYSLITWRGRGLYERTIVLPNGRVIHEYTQATYNRGGCRA